jgi:hypothetical protein
LDVAQLKARAEALDDQFKLISETLAVMGQDIKSTKQKSFVSLPKEITNKIDPAAVFVAALQAAVTVQIGKHNSPQALLTNIDSQADYILDIAMGIFQAFLRRHGK